MKIFKNTLLTLSILWIAFSFMTNQEWKITKDFAIQFSNNDVVGIFSKFEGNVTFDKENLSTSKFNFSVELSSVNTGNETQNGHLKNADWFDVKKFPTATFETSSITKSEAGYIANGIFQLHGIKKEMVIPISFIENESKGEITSTFYFDRTDFNVGKKGDGVDENMKIEVKIPVER